MKRRIAMVAVLCLALVALMAMAIAAAPAASAHPKVIHWTATEIFAEPPNIVSQTTVGDVTIIKMSNHLRDFDAKDALGNPVPMGNAELFTKGTWIVTDPPNAIMMGTYRAVSTDGSVFLGKWAGSMNMGTGAMDYVGRGHGVRGPGLGMTLYTRGVNPGLGAPTAMTQTALRLCWSPWEH